MHSAFSSGKESHLDANSFSELQSSVEPGHAALHRQLADEGIQAQNKYEPQQVSSPSHELLFKNDKFTNSSLSSNSTAIEYPPSFKNPSEAYTFTPNDNLLTEDVDGSIEGFRNEEEEDDEDDDGLSLLNIIRESAIQSIPHFRREKIASAKRGSKHQRHSKNRNEAAELPPKGTPISFKGVDSAGDEKSKGFIRKVGRAAAPMAISMEVFEKCLYSTTASFSTPLSNNIKIVAFDFACEQDFFRPTFAQPELDDANEEAISIDNQKQPDVLPPELEISHEYSASNSSSSEKHHLSADSFSFQSSSAQIADVPVTSLYLFFLHSIVPLFEFGIIKPLTLPQRCRVLAAELEKLVDIPECGGDDFESKTQSYNNSINQNKSPLSFNEIANKSPSEFFLDLSASLLSNPVIRSLSTQPAYLKAIASSFRFCKDSLVKEYNVWLEKQKLISSAEESLGVYFQRQFRLQENTSQKIVSNCSSSNNKESNHLSSVLFHPEAPLRHVLHPLLEFSPLFIQLISIDSVNSILECNSDGCRHNGAITLSSTPFTSSGFSDFTSAHQNAFRHPSHLTGILHQLYGSNMHSTSSNFPFTSSHFTHSSSTSPPARSTTSSNSLSSRKQALITTPALELDPLSSMTSQSSSLLLPADSEEFLDTSFKYRSASSASSFSSNSYSDANSSVSSTLYPNDYSPLGVQRSSSASFPDLTFPSPSAEQKTEAQQLSPCQQMLFHILDQLILSQSPVVNLLCLIAHRLSSSFSTDIATETIAEICVGDDALMTAWCQLQLMMDSPSSLIVRSVPAECVEDEVENEDFDKDENGKYNVGSRHFKHSVKHKDHLHTNNEEKLIRHQRRRSSSFQIRRPSSKKAVPNAASLVTASLLEATSAPLTLKTPEGNSAVFPVKNSFTRSRQHYPPLLHGIPPEAQRSVQKKNGWYSVIYAPLNLHRLYPPHDSFKRCTQMHDFAAHEEISNTTKNATVKFEVNVEDKTEQDLRRSILKGEAKIARFVKWKLLNFGKQLASLYAEDNKNGSNFQVESTIATTKPDEKQRTEKELQKTANKMHQKKNNSSQSNEKMQLKLIKKRLHSLARIIYLPSADEDDRTLSSYFADDDAEDFPRISSKKKLRASFSASSIDLSIRDEMSEAYSVANDSSDDGYSLSFEREQGNDVSTSDAKTGSTIKPADDNQFLTSRYSSPLKLSYKPTNRQQTSEVKDFEDDCNSQEVQADDAKKNLSATFLSPPTLLLSSANQEDASVNNTESTPKELTDVKKTNKGNAIQSSLGDSTASSAMSIRSTCSSYSSSLNCSCSSMEESDGHSIYSPQTSPFWPEGADASKVEYKKVEENKHSTPKSKVMRIPCDSSDSSVEETFSCDSQTIPGKESSSDGFCDDAATETGSFERKTEPPPPPLPYFPELLQQILQLPNLVTYLDSKKFEKDKTKESLMYSSVSNVNENDNEKRDSSSVSNLSFFDLLHSSACPPYVYRFSNIAIQELFTSLFELRRFFRAATDHLSEQLDELQPNQFSQSSNQTNKTEQKKQQYSAAFISNASVSKDSTSNSRSNSFTQLSSDNSLLPVDFFPSSSFSSSSFEFQNLSNPAQSNKKISFKPLNNSFHEASAFAQPSSSCSIPKSYAHQLDYQNSLRTGLLSTSLLRSPSRWLHPVLSPSLTTILFLLPPSSLPIYFSFVFKKIDQQLTASFSSMSYSSPQVPQYSLLLSSSRYHPHILTQIFFSFALSLYAAGCVRTDLLKFLCDAIKGKRGKEGIIETMLHPYFPFRSVELLKVRLTCGHFEKYHKSQFSMMKSENDEASKDLSAISNGRDASADFREKWLETVVESGVRRFQDVFLKERKTKFQLQMALKTTLKSMSRYIISELQKEQQNRQTSHFSHLIIRSTGSTSPQEQSGSYLPSMEYSSFLSASSFTRRYAPHPFLPQCDSDSFCIEGDDIVSASMIADDDSLFGKDDLGSGSTGSSLFEQLRRKDEDFEAEDEAENLSIFSPKSSSTSDSIKILVFGHFLPTDKQLVASKLDLPSNAAKLEESFAQHLSSRSRSASFQTKSSVAKINNEPKDLLDLMDILQIKVKNEKSGTSNLHRSYISGSETESPSISSHHIQTSNNASNDSVVAFNPLQQKTRAASSLQSEGLPVSSSKQEQPKNQKSTHNSKCIPLSSCFSQKSPIHSSLLLMNDCSHAIKLMWDRNLLPFCDVVSFFHSLSNLSTASQYIIHFVLNSAIHHPLLSFLCSSYLSELLSSPSSTTSQATLSHIRVILPSSPTYLSLRMMAGLCLCSIPLTSESAVRVILHSATPRVTPKLISTPQSPSPINRPISPLQSATKHSQMATPQQSGRNRSASVMMPRKRASALDSPFPKPKQINIPFLITEEAFFDEKDESDPVQSAQSDNPFSFLSTFELLSLSVSFVPASSSSSIHPFMHFSEQRLPQLLSVEFAQTPLSERGSNRSLSIPTPFLFLALSHEPKSRIVSVDVPAQSSPSFTSTFLQIISYCALTKVIVNGCINACIKNKNRCSSKEFKNATVKKESKAPSLYHVFNSPLPMDIYRSSFNEICNKPSSLLPSELLTAVMLDNGKMNALSDVVFSGLGSQNYFCTQNNSFIDSQSLSCNTDEVSQYLNEQPSFVAFVSLTINHLYSNNPLFIWRACSAIAYISPFISWHYLPLILSRLFVLCAHPNIHSRLTWWSENEKGRIQVKLQQNTSKKDEVQSSSFSDKRDSTTFTCGKMEEDQKDAHILQAPRILYHSSQRLDQQQPVQSQLNSSKQRMSSLPAVSYITIANAINAIQSILLSHPAFIGYYDIIAKLNENVTKSYEFADSMQIRDETEEKQGRYIISVPYCFVQSNLFILSQIFSNNTTPQSSVKDSKIYFGEFGVVDQASSQSNPFFTMMTRNYVLRELHNLSDPLFMHKKKYPASPSASPSPSWNVINSVSPTFSSPATSNSPLMNQSISQDASQFTSLPPLSPVGFAQSNKNQQSAFPVPSSLDALLLVSSLISVAASWIADDSSPEQLLVVCVTVLRSFQCKYLLTSFAHTLCSRLERSLNWRIMFTSADSEKILQPSLNTDHFFQYSKPSSSNKVSCSPSPNISPQLCPSPPLIGSHLPRIALPRSVFSSQSNVTSEQSQQTSSALSDRTDIKVTASKGNSSDFASVPTLRSTSLEYSSTPPPFSSVAAICLQLRLLSALGVMDVTVSQTVVHFLNWAKSAFPKTDGELVTYCNQKNDSSYGNLSEYFNEDTEGYIYKKQEHNNSKLRDLLETEDIEIYEILSEASKQQTYFSNDKSQRQKDNSLTPKISPQNLLTPPQPDLSRTTNSPLIQSVSSFSTSPESAFSTSQSEPSNDSMDEIVSAIGELTLMRGDPSFEYVSPEEVEEEKENAEAIQRAEELDRLLLKAWNDEHGAVNNATFWCQNSCNSCISCFTEKHQTISQSMGLNRYPFSSFVDQTYQLQRVDSLDGLTRRFSLPAFFSRMASASIPSGSPMNQTLLPFGVKQGSERIIRKAKNDVIPRAAQPQSSSSWKSQNSSFQSKETQLLLINEKEKSIPESMSPLFCNPSFCLCCSSPPSPFPFCFEHPSEQFIGCNHKFSDGLHSDTKTDNCSSPFSLHVVDDGLFQDSDNAWSCQHNISHLPSLRTEIERISVETQLTATSLVESSLRKRNASLSASGSHTDAEECVFHIVKSLSSCASLSSLTLQFNAFRCLCNISPYRSTITINEVMSLLYSSCQNYRFIVATEVIRFLPFLGLNREYPVTPLTEDQANTLFQEQSDSTNKKRSSYLKSLASFSPQQHNCATLMYQLLTMMKELPIFDNNLTEFNRLNEALIRSANAPSSTTTPTISLTSALPDVSLLNKNTTKWENTTTFPLDPTQSVLFTITSEWKKFIQTAIETTLILMIGVISPHAMRFVLGTSSFDADDEKSASITYNKDAQNLFDNLLSRFSNSSLSSRLIYLLRSQQQFKRHLLWISSNEKGSLKKDVVELRENDYQPLYISLSTASLDLPFLSLLCSTLLPYLNCKNVDIINSTCSVLGALSILTSAKYLSSIVFGVLFGDSFSIEAKLKVSLTIHALQLMDITNLIDFSENEDIKPPEICLTKDISPKQYVSSEMKVFSLTMIAQPIIDQLTALHELVALLKEYSSNFEFSKLIVMLINDLLCSPFAFYPLKHSFVRDNNTYLLQSSLCSNKQSEKHASIEQIHLHECALPQSIIDAIVILIDSLNVLQSLTFPVFSQFLHQQLTIYPHFSLPFSLSAAIQRVLQSSVDESHEFQVVTSADSQSRFHSMTSHSSSRKEIPLVQLSTSLLNLLPSFAEMATVFAQTPLFEASDSMRLTTTQVLPVVSTLSYSDIQLPLNFISESRKTSVNKKVRAVEAKEESSKNEKKSPTLYVHSRISHQQHMALWLQQIPNTLQLNWATLHSDLKNIIEVMKESQRCDICKEVTSRDGCAKQADETAITCSSEEIVPSRTAFNNEKNTLICQALPCLSQTNDFVEFHNDDGFALIEEKSLQFDSKKENSESLDDLFSSNENDPIQSLSQPISFSEQNAYKSPNLLLSQTPSPAIIRSFSIIDMDISRTSLFSSLNPDISVDTDTVRLLLQLFTVRCPSIPFLQGMSYLAALFSVGGDLFSSYSLLCNLISSPFFVSLFTMNSEFLIKLDLYFLHLLSKAKHPMLQLLASLFTAKEIQLDFVHTWFISLFAQSFNVEISIIVMDHLLPDDPTFLFRAALSLLIQILRNHNIQIDQSTSAKQAKRIRAEAAESINEALRGKRSHHINISPSEFLKTVYEMDVEDKALFWKFWNSIYASK
ncbi:Tre-2/Bub2/Cdc16 (TBC) domain-containing protein E [Monocercomonoides exilis]|uniref:Tre-2/Bub2/Cdc16 (TBC) domain-containing protein E n=1 Tax=Monocercomonoides exilis TaxID=2049356 RepID=UPI00355A4B1A|nr:Tre-2/Bub2/Cdc16 (TBC) domain-containing protein E [Monocercomonoides exilis]|eukprot:MONOS_3965.1-p1 / transcript=MONOS_3965.1 / gene=MONOS_3965 / organism=Monocercomonoides_exilis_PA203 / gene_product=Tre-2/Bub2/Cdc16 (TBC) domain-containing protein E / transcript_product=Tre-2/Bub2/Cdc16 (TBC) domain-containing protein E / location=Mono_scaffold00099:49913-64336(+) / protein_length=4785 / sequence_SO=supercontig / SO=protein_coding / is_pseudo=false